MNFTESQLQAINIEGSNIIVSAGAGSGKTAVLTERVLRKVKEGIDIRKILILTFTNEAAGEMKERIRKKIKKAGLKKQLEYIDSAYITTFDAYALAIVKKYHYLFNISNNIRIIDSSIIDLKKEEILNDIFLELYKEKNKNFLKLVGDFTSRDDETLKVAILNINKSLELKYDKKEFLEKYIENFYKKEYIDDLFLEYFVYLKDLANLIESDIYSLEEYMDDKAYQKIYDAYSVFIKPVSYYDLEKIKSIPKVQFRDLAEEAITIKDNLKNNVKELFELTRYSEEELKEQVKSTVVYVRSIIDIILKLDERILKYKKENEAFEFGDISKMAIRLVKEHHEVREEIKNYYQEILIDEYQDTNDLQELFIEEIENNNVYMVGDIKQSIYRFRNANPDIFKNKYVSYEKHIKGEKIDLVKNFRSREEVLFNINTIFEFIMTLEIGGVNYHNNHAMVYGNMAYSKEGNTNQNSNMDILKYDEVDGFSNSSIEAFTIAHNIKEKIENNYEIFDFDINQKRKASYKDFCIILDRGTDMPLYKKIFEFLNIPMDVYKDSDLVDSNDILIIKNIINLILKIFDKEYDKKMQYYFVSIARSFIGDLTDEEIFELINSNTFYKSDIYKKCVSLTAYLENKTICSLLDEIIDTFAFYEKMIKIGNVEASLIRIDNLLSIASSASDLGFTIRDFSTYLEKMIDNKKEIRYKEIKASSNCVKIMNIHKSKGLEFPICYFAGFKKTFNISDLKSKFMFDNKYGILTPYFKEGIGTLFTKNLIKNKYYQEEISEKIRLFYVALTRAKEKIIMVIPEFKLEHKEYNAISKIEGLKFRSFYDFINIISLNLKEYMTKINIEDIHLTKDYMYANKKAIEIEKNDKLKIKFSENEFDSKLLDNLHASKTINTILNKEEAKTLEFGTSLHNRLEMTNFKKDYDDKYINNLKKNFDFDKAVVYQELEFMYEKDNSLYHGIIDLMLEYEDEIKIIDYKLKNIDDDGYIKQLETYYNYVKTVSDKRIKLYLYSILDNKIKEITLVNV